MSSNSFELLENTNRKKIVKEFITTRRELNYEYLTNLLEDDTTRADWHLTKLVEAGFLKRTKQRGYYKLNEQNIQILRNYFSEIVPICLIGGLDEYGKPKNTFSKEQFESLERLMRIIKSEHLDLTVHGHNEFSDKACPCFSVKDWLVHLDESLKIINKADRVYVKKAKESFWSRLWKFIGV